MALVNNDTNIMPYMIVTTKNLWAITVALLTGADRDGDPVSGCQTKELSMLFEDLVHKSINPMAKIKTFAENAIEQIINNNNSLKSMNVILFT